MTERTLGRVFDGVLVVLVGLLLWATIANADDDSNGFMYSVLSVSGIWLICWFWVRRRAPLPDDDWKATAYASIPLGMGLGLGAMAATSVYYDLVLLGGGRYVTVWATQATEHRNKGGSITYGYDLVGLDGISLPHRLYTLTAGLTGRITVFDDPGGVAPPLLSNDVPFGRHLWFLVAMVVLFGLGVWIVVRRMRRARTIEDA